MLRLLDIPDRFIAALKEMLQFAQNAIREGGAKRLLPHLIFYRTNLQMRSAALFAWLHEYSQQLNSPCNQLVDLILSGTSDNPVVLILRTRRRTTIGFLKYVIFQFNDGISVNACTSMIILGVSSTGRR